MLRLLRSGHGSLLAGCTPRYEKVTPLATGEGRSLRLFSKPCAEITYSNKQTKAIITVPTPRAAGKVKCKGAGKADVLAVILSLRC